VHQLRDILEWSCDDKRPVNIKEIKKKVRYALDGDMAKDERHRHTLNTVTLYEQACALEMVEAKGFVLVVDKPFFEEVEVFEEFPFGGPQLRGRSVSEGHFW